MAKLGRKKKESECTVNKLYEYIGPRYNETVGESAFRNRFRILEI